MKSKYVYIIIDEFRYDNTPEENYESCSRAYSSLKKAVEHLELWYDIYHSNMRNSGELYVGGNYVSLDINDRNKEFSRLFMRNGDKLHITHIRRIFLY